PRGRWSGDRAVEGAGAGAGGRNGGADHHVRWLGRGRDARGPVQALRSARGAQRLARTVRTRGARSRSVRHTRRRIRRRRNPRMAGRRGRWTIGTRRSSDGRRPRRSHRRLPARRRHVSTVECWRVRHRHPLHTEWTYPRTVRHPRGSGRATLGAGDIPVKPRMDVALVTELAMREAHAVQPLVSIAIPSVNRLGYLKEAV